MQTQTQPQPQPPPAPAGWYDDPSRPGRQRYWDGQQWSDDFRDPPCEPAPDQPGTLSFANGGVLRVVADAPGSVRLEAWHLEAGTHSVTLTSRDIYNLSKAMVDALDRTQIESAIDRLRPVLDDQYRTPTELAQLAGLTLAAVGGCLSACSRTGEVEAKWDGKQTHWRRRVTS